MNFYILTGGRSRRLGRDKAFLRLDGQTLTEKVLSLIPKKHSVKVVANAAQAFEFVECPVITDIHKDLGPIGGIHAGLTDTTSDFGFFIACDLPFIPHALILRILQDHADEDVFGIRGKDGNVPLCTIYSKRCLAVIESQILNKDYSLRRLSELLHSAFIEAIDEFDLLNVNTERDWQTAQSMAKQRN